MSFERIHVPEQVQREPGPLQVPELDDRWAWGGILLIIALCVLSGTAYEIMTALCGNGAAQSQASGSGVDGSVPASSNE